MKIERVLRASKKHIQEAPADLKFAMAQSLVQELAIGKFHDSEAIDILCEMIVWLDEESCNCLVCEAMVAVTHNE